MEISNCPITKMQVSVVKTPYIDSKHSADYKKYKMLHTGIDILCKNVYSVCDGVVIAIGRNATSYCITVQYSADACVRYMDIRKCNVNIGDIIEKGVLIGNVDEYVHFEYALASTNVNSDNIVRVDDCSYVKVDPTPVADESIILKSSGLSNIVIAYGYDCPAPKLTDAMAEEFGNNRGDEDYWV